MHLSSVFRRVATAGAAFLFFGGMAFAQPADQDSQASARAVDDTSTEAVSIPGSVTLPNGVILIPEIKHDVSAPLSWITPVPPSSEKEMEPWRRIPVRLPVGQEDPVVQTSPGIMAMPASTSFEGMGAGMSGFSPGGTPPDTNGDVGPNHYVQTVNTSLTVFSRAGAVLLGPESISTLWSGFGGGCQTNNDGDPVVKYDRAANRWVVSQFSVSSTPYMQCVAVSQTSDPTGAWYRYSYSFGSSNFNDYPKIGVWPDAYYFSFNIFANGSTFSGGMACAFDRTDMLTGGTAKPTQCFGPEANDGGLLPSDMTGTTAPPAGSPDYYVDLQTSSLNLFKFHVDWTTPSNSTFSGPTSLAVASYSALCGGGTCVPQPGTSQQLDSLADRLMYRFAYRNMGTYESLVVDHSVSASSGGGVRWYEIRSPNGTPSIFQQGTYAPDSSYRWMGSIAMDHVGDIAAGYSISASSSIDPGIRFAGRLVGDALGTFGQGEGTMVTGGGVNTGSYSRWGDYSSMSIDPTDDCTFWYTTEYYASTGDSFHWQTRIGNFKFSTCSSTGTPDFAISASPTSVSVVQGNSGTSTISTTVSGGFNNAISLSASGQPSGVTVSFNPTSIAAPGSGSSTMTMTVGSSVAAGTYAITVTGSGGGVTHTTSVSLTVTVASSPSFTIAASPSSVSVAQGGSGTSTVSTTVSGGFNNAISLSASGQPSGVTVSFNPTSIAAPGSGSSTMTMTVGSSVAAGTYAITVTGSGGGITHTASVSLTVTTSGGTSLTNGGFETGNFTGWTTSGTTAVTTSAKHSGTYGAMLGSTSPTNGDSTVVQTFTLPSGSPTLSFWYANTCPDTVTYDWATVTLKDNASGTTTTLLAKTCTATPVWKQVSYNASTSAGHSVTLTLVSHDDNYPGDPTYTYYDDVAVTVATPDFAISASPSSVSVAQGASGTSTISTSVSGGFNSSIALSASGQPSGVTVSFNPASIAAPGSGSSTMTMTVGSSVAAGTYPITVTGTGGGVTHTTSVNLTVTIPVSNVVVNGGFETGNFTGWTTSGTTAVTTSAKHSGTYGAMLGSTSPTNGDSTVVQTFTLGSSSPSVSFWYANTCPDTLTYDWATATLKDNATGTTTTILAKTCTATPIWTQVNYNASASAGHSVTLTLVSHDDNYPGDPTYTFYDDVVAH